MKEYELTEFETAFISELVILLAYHTASQMIIENFLTYVTITRLNYGKVREGFRLKFDLDLDGKTLKVSEIRNKKT